MATLAGRNLPARARARGLLVIERPGWEGRSDGSFDARGIILHHDAMGLGYVNSNLSDNLNVVRNMEQPGANGSQLWIGRDTEGKMRLVFMAAGRKYHAGNGGGFRNIQANLGNATTVGIETDHTTGTGWDAEMRHYIDVTTRLLVEEFGLDPQRDLAGHKEYAPDRKIDPEDYDLDAWRARAGNATKPPVPSPAPTPNREDFDVASVQEVVDAVWDQHFEDTNGTQPGGGASMGDIVNAIYSVVRKLDGELDTVRTELAALKAAVAKLPKA